MPEENNIERLKKRLYKKGESFGMRMKRARLEQSEESKTSDYWESSTPFGRKKRRFGFLKFLIAVASVFLIASSAAVAYFLLGGGNIISDRNIDIEAEGPVYAEAGRIIDLNIIIENKNNSALELTDLIIEYPQGAVSAENFEFLKSKERYSLGKINPGERKIQTLNFALLGKKDEDKKIIATLEYRTENSNAIFAKTKEHIVKILSAPLGISIDTPKNARSNEEMSIMVEIVSNSDAIMRDLVLLMEYPPGFQFVSASPHPIEGDSRWAIGDLESLQKRNIEIRGVIEGQDLEERAVRATVGAAEENSIIMYAEESETIVIKKPFLDFSLAINGKDLESNSVEAGGSVRAEILWKNNLPVKIRNAAIEIKINGRALNKKSVSAGRGFYRESDSVIIWNSSSLSDLASIVPGQEGRVQFSFAISDPLPVSGGGDKNFIVNLDGRIFGTSVSADSGSAEISNSVKKQVKVLSGIQVASRALYYSGAFENSGPMPPRAGKETTYAIVWSISNFYNDASGVEVRASLPPYIRWTGNISPQDAEVAFDESTGEVVWSPGNISAGTGIIRPAKEVAFQIGLTPSQNQIGSSPTLVFGTALEAYDDFVGEDLADTKTALTTALKSDPKFSFNEGKVIE